MAEYNTDRLTPTRLTVGALNSFKCFQKQGFWNLWIVHPIIIVVFKIFHHSIPQKGNGVKLMGLPDESNKPKIT